MQSLLNRSEDHITVNLRVAFKQNNRQRNYRESRGDCTTQFI